MNIYRWQNEGCIILITEDDVEKARKAFRKYAREGSSLRNKFLSIIESQAYIEESPMLNELLWVSTQPSGYKFRSFPNHILLYLGKGFKIEKPTTADLFK